MNIYRLKFEHLISFWWFYKAFFLCLFHGQNKQKMLPWGFSYDTTINKKMQHLMYLTYFIKAQKVSIVGLIDFHNRIGVEMIFMEISYTSWSERIPENYIGSVKMENISASLCSLAFIPLSGALSGVSFCFSLQKRICSL